MDQFIFKNVLKWIPYEKFKNIGYLDKEEFGTSIYKAKPVMARRVLPLPRISQKSKT